MSDLVPNVEASPAVAMIVAERRRQIGELGYSLEHDREHDRGELALAAAWYALTPELRAGALLADHLGELLREAGFVTRGNTDRRRDLAKAGALIVAELERLTLAPWVDTTLTHDDFDRPLAGRGEA